MSTDLTTDYIVNNGNYDNKDLSEIFLQQSPLVYRYENDFVRATFDELEAVGWTVYGSGSRNFLGGTGNNPGQVELITNGDSDNGISGLYYFNQPVGTSISQLEFIVKTTSDITNDNQLVYAGLSTVYNPPTKENAINVYIGIGPKSGTSIVDTRFQCYVNSSVVETFAMTWEIGYWYDLLIELEKTGTDTDNAGNITFTVKNLSSGITESIKVNNNASGAFEFDKFYGIVFEQRIDSSRKTFYLDYISYTNEVTRVS